MNRRNIIGVPVALLAASLVGCTGPAVPAATPTVTVTSTVTVSPTPELTRSADEAISELDAWLVCYGATYGVYNETSSLFPFTAEAVTDNGDGTFEVRVPFAPRSGEGSGAESICVAGGTAGDPSVELRGGRDFG